MKHTRAVHPPNYECCEMSCNICNLFICSVCGGAEGSLTTDCCCYKVPYIMDQLVYAEAIDFVVDQWVAKRPMQIKVVMADEVLVEED